MEQYSSNVEHKLSLEYQKKPNQRSRTKRLFRRKRSLSCSRCMLEFGRNREKNEPLRSNKRLDLSTHTKSHSHHSQSSPKSKQPHPLFRIIILPILIITFLLGWGLTYAGSKKYDSKQNKKRRHLCNH